MAERLRDFHRRLKAAEQQVCSLRETASGMQPVVEEQRAYRSIRGPCRSRTAGNLR